MGLVQWFRPHLGLVQVLRNQEHSLEEEMMANFSFAYPSKGTAQPCSCEADTACPNRSLHMILEARIIAIITPHRTPSHPT